jgi:proline iminopeptidase
MSRFAGGPPPYESGFLDVGDGQHIYWEQGGNPTGKPVVMLHGGPGAAPRSGVPRAIDPDSYRVVRFHQRGCGLSKPHAGELGVPLTANTTQHLISDIERLRSHLDIDAWLVYGASWGVTLGLAYAQAFPGRVTEMLLVSVTMTRAADVHWLAHEAGRFFPEQWHRFRDHVPEAERDDLVAAYDRLVNHDPDPEVRLGAARRWCAWEDALLSLDQQPYTGSRTQSDAELVCFARLVTHYFAHAGFLEDDQLLRDLHRLIDIPAVLVHGRLDIQGPPDVAWLLARHWPAAELHLVGTGHAGGGEMSDRISEAFARWKPR